MRAVVQRVRSAKVTVGERTTGEIAQGLLVYLGVGVGDGDAQLAYMVEKITAMRIFHDDAEKMNRSVVDVGGAVLVVSQFTLYGDVRKGRRPSFDAAMPPEEAKAVYERFVDRMRATGIKVATGEFRATMIVSSEVDGPVTMLVDSAKGF